MRLTSTYHPGQDHGHEDLDAEHRDFDSGKNDLKPGYEDIDSRCKDQSAQGVAGYWISGSTSG